MKRLRDLGLVAIGFGVGALTFNWPFGLSENDAEQRLVEYRENRGGTKVRAACHERPQRQISPPDFLCEVSEAIGRESPGYGEYIVRRRGDNLVFERIP